MWIPLLLPFIGLLWVPFYNFHEPALFGFPFFYWYQLGAYGFFALPYTIIIYPFVFAVMPMLWKAAHVKGHVTTVIAAWVSPDRRSVIAPS